MSARGSAFGDAGQAGTWWLDAVITQNPQVAIMSCVRIFANLRDHRDTNIGVETVRSKVIFRDNLP